MHHSGEGIFFSSQLPRLFEIYANGLHFLRDNQERDWTFSENNLIKSGTSVIMHFSLESKSEIIALFQQFQNNDTLQFDRTEIIVKLSQFEEDVFISRSQAKRILRNLDRFQKVILDFSHVRMIGQGFVDEIFRVYQSAHPDMEIQYIHANPDVRFMIERGVIQNK